MSIQRGTNPIEFPHSTSGLVYASIRAFIGRTNIFYLLLIAKGYTDEKKYIKDSFNSTFNENILRPAITSTAGARFHVTSTTLRRHNAKS